MTQPGHLVYSIRTCGHLLIYRETANGEFELVECPNPDEYKERADRFKKFMLGKTCPGCGKIISECMKHDRPALSDLNFAEEVDIGRENMEFINNLLNKQEPPATPNHE